MKHPICPFGAPIRPAGAPSLKGRNLRFKAVGRTGLARRGFTLIEIMIVVLIIAILAALIIPRLFNNTDKAKIAAAKSDIASLSTALSSYRLDNDSFPSTEDGLDALRVQPSDAPHWKGPYIEKAIGNDPWGNPYAYVSPGPDGQDYLITSYGSDGAPGGDGNAADITSDQQ